MIEWTLVGGSSRVTAEAYLEDSETILVRFPDGVEWAYSACPPSVWAQFTAPGQSRGAFIAQVLDAKPNRRWSG
jgi:hypothetical protein